MWKRSRRPRDTGPLSRPKSWPSWPRKLYLETRGANKSCRFGTGEFGLQPKGYETDERSLVCNESNADSSQILLDSGCGILLLGETRPVRLAACPTSKCPGNSAGLRFRVHFWDGHTTSHIGSHDTQSHLTHGRWPQSSSPVKLLQARGSALPGGIQLKNSGGKEEVEIKRFPKLV